jgi:hypothetical protein
MTGLVKKTKEGRQNKAKKRFGTARILTMEEAIRKKEERKAKDQQPMDEKERRAALWGLVGFGKMVWKEFQMGKTYLNEISFLRREPSTEKSVER